MKRPHLRSVTGRVLVEAHGDSSAGAQNSWPAIHAGWSAGADIIEIDVQTSRDGVAFLFHNYMLPDTRWTHELSWAELADVTVRGQPLPLLVDVLSWAGAAGAFLTLDLKSGFRPPAEVHETVAKLVASAGAEDRVLVSNRDHHEIRATKQAHPELMTRAAVAARLTRLDQLLDDVAPDVITMPWHLCRRDDVDLAHDRGVAVTFVDGWHDDCISAAVALGADAVSWPDPVSARELLRQAGATT